MKRGIVLISLLLLAALVLTSTQALASAPAAKKTPVPPGQSIRQPEQAGNHDKKAKEGKVVQGGDEDGDDEGYPPDRPGNPNKDKNKDKDKNPNHPDKDLKKENLRGVILSMDGDTLVIELKNGEQVTIHLAGARIHFPGKALAELQPGMQLMVHAWPGEEGYTALAVQVIPGKPTRLHRVGTVIAYEPGVSITIQGKDGATTFSLAGDARLVNGLPADIVVGQTVVTIISPRDVTAGPNTPPIAHGIVIHGPTEDEAE